MRKDISMTDAEVAAALAEGKKAQVATLGRDGWPHVTTLWYVMRDGLVTFRSFTKSQRIVNLRRDPRVTVLVEFGVAYEELRGVMIQGRARLTADPDLVIDVYAQVLGRLADTPPNREAAEALYRRYAHKNTVVQVEPVNIISWDHRKLGGTY